MKEGERKKVLEDRLEILNWITEISNLKLGRGKFEAKCQLGNFEENDAKIAFFQEFSAKIQPQTTNFMSQWS